MTNPIIARLEKLIALSTSSNEHEAHAAATRATELMAKHQITHADLAAFASQADHIVLESGRIDAEEDAESSSRCEAWHLTLLSSVVHALGGRGWRSAYKRSYRFYMMGPPDTTSAARYIFMQLSACIGRLARQAMKASHETNSWRRGYAEGMSMRVGIRLIEARKSALTQASTTALVVIDRTTQRIDEEFASRGFAPVKATGSRSLTAKAQGYRDGAHVELPSSDSPVLTSTPPTLKE